MNLATTFDKSHYNLYGKRWINSVIKYWPKSVNVFLYINFQIENLPENFTIIDFDFKTKQKKLKDILNTKYLDSNSKSKHIKEQTLKFSFKSFVIENELKRYGDTFIWLDGDVETISSVKFEEIKSFVADNFLACQSEKHSRKAQHTESGILIFDLKNKDTEEFRKQFFECYTSDKIFVVKKPYDGYIISYILKKNSYKFFDFNADTFISGKTSTSTDTFKHIFLKNHFIHRISDEKLKV